MTVASWGVKPAAAGPIMTNPPPPNKKTQRLKHKEREDYKLVNQKFLILFSDKEDWN